MGLVGIDVGNQTCVVSVFREPQPSERPTNDPYLDWRLNHISIALNDFSGKPQIPTLVVFKEDYQQRFVGAMASTVLATTDPHQTIPQIKRLIGRKFLDREVQQDIEQGILPFRITEADSDGSILIHVNYLNQPRSFTPTQILGMLLSNLKTIAQNALESNVTECVIGIPCFFTPIHRQAVMEAVAIAGLPPPRLMHQTTAGALFYTIRRENLPDNDAAGSMTVVFADVGHASTQISISAVRKGFIKVLSHVSDSSLGGRDFDEVLFRHFCKEFKTKYGMDVLSNKKACRKLRAECEKLKKDLSSKPPGYDEITNFFAIDCFMDIDGITRGSMNRRKMEWLCDPLLERLKLLCRTALAEAKISTRDVDAVEMLGLGSMIPAILRVFDTEFGKEPSKVTLNACSTGAQQSVSGGCALQCALLSPTTLGCRPAIEIQDTLPFSISLEWKEAGFALELEDETESSTQSSCTNVVVFAKGSPFPTTRMLRFCNQQKHSLLTLDVLSTPDYIPSTSPHKISTFTIGPFKAEMAKINLQISLNCNGMMSLQFANDDTEEVAVAEVIVGSMDLKQAILEESEMAKHDLLMREVDDERDELEGYLRDTKVKIYDVFEPYTTEEEREDLTTRLEETLNWLSKAMNEAKSVYSDKLADLKKKVCCINMYRSTAESKPKPLKSKVFDELEQNEKWLKDTLLPSANPIKLSADSSSKYPIRVIDVKQTLEHEQGGVVFVNPKNWNFHVISHTWSRGIQSWSNDVVNDLENLQSSMSYETLFSSKDFRTHNCYKPFIKFLKLLQSDGVRLVWLDTLCINQQDGSTEKVQEIQRMGSYYAKSVGCYVCAHGFGESFKPFATVTGPGEISRKDLPRWFSRVWTFQEFLLPSRLSFIFSLGQSREAVIKSVLQLEGNIANKPCDCALNYINNTEAIENSYTEQYSYPVQPSTYPTPCGVCGGSKSIRLVYQMRIDERNNLYFIDRKSFPEIWRAKVDKDERFREIESIKVYFPDKLSRLEVFLDLQSSYMKRAEEVHRIRAGVGTYSELVNMGDEQEITSSEAGSDGELSSYILDPVQVIGEVSQRDCTHDEDRVLSVLGLLGIEGAVQMRLGRSPEQQLLDVAQQMAKSPNKRLHTVLVQLCIAQFDGSTIKGMSWAPSFKDLQPLGELGKPDIRNLSREEAKQAANMLEVEENRAKTWRVQMGTIMVNLKKSVVVEDVLNDGTLVFAKARVLWDCSFTRTKHEEQNDLNDFNLHVGNLCKPFRAHHTSSSCLLVHFNVLCVGQGMENTLKHPTPSIVNLPSSYSDINEFKVHLVLLGQIGLPSTTNERLEVMMICMGDKSQGPLQKVGTGWISGLEPIFLETPFSKCSIGGKLSS